LQYQAVEVEVRSLLELQRLQLLALVLEQHLQY
jgi:hypothetical protein